MFSQVSWILIILATNLVQSIDYGGRCENFMGKDKVYTTAGSSICYNIVLESSNWAESHHSCRAANGTLVTIRNNDTQMLLTRALLAIPEAHSWNLWIGFFPIRGGHPYYTFVDEGDCSTVLEGDERVDCHPETNQPDTERRCVEDRDCCWNELHGVEGNPPFCHYKTNKGGPPEFRPWAPTQPDSLKNTDENLCILMFKDRNWLWDDQNCNEAHKYSNIGYICELKMIDHTLSFASTLGHAVTSITKGQEVTTVIPLSSSASAKISFVRQISSTLVGEQVSKHVFTVPPFVSGTPSLASSLTTFGQSDTPTSMLSETKTLSSMTSTMISSLHGEHTPPASPTVTVPHSWSSDSWGNMDEEATVIRGRSLCYVINHDNKTWEEAFRTCHETGGELLMIKDNSTQYFLQQQLRLLLGTELKRFWVGIFPFVNLERLTWTNDGTCSIHTPGSERADCHPAEGASADVCTHDLGCCWSELGEGEDGPWCYYPNTIHDNSNFDAWSPGNPVLEDAKLPRCAVVSGDRAWGWEDRSCSETNNYICQYNETVPGARPCRTSIPVTGPTPVSSMSSTQIYVQTDGLGRNGSRPGTGSSEASISVTSFTLVPSMSSIPIYMSSNGSRANETDQGQSNPGEGSRLTEGALIGILSLVLILIVIAIIGTVFTIVKRMRTNKAKEQLLASYEAKTMEVKIGSPAPSTNYEILQEEDTC